MKKRRKKPLQATFFRSAQSNLNLPFPARTKMNSFRINLLVYFRKWPLFFLLYSATFLSILMQKALPLDEPSKISTQRIPYDLPDRKNWNGLVLVGEAPGAEEVRLGHPFVGRSGQLLNNILTSAGIERSNCLIANVFCVRPPNNKVDAFFISRRAAKEQNIDINEGLGKFGSTYCRAEFSSEFDSLKTMLSTWKPTVIIALGRTPFWALTGENGLLNQVGNKFDCRLLKGATVIPTFHPSFILRGNWKLQDVWKEHFLIAQQQARE